MLPDRVTVWIIKACAVLALLLILWLYAFGKGRDSMADRAHVAEAERDAATANVQQLNRTLSTERAKSAELNKLAERYESEKNEIETQRDALARRIARGEQRLQPWWTCQAGDVPDAAASTSEPHAVADDRAGSAARIVAAADACDAQVRGLQAVILADRNQP